MKKKAYKCPRCGYESHHKTNIKNHFFKTKKPCPATCGDIDLTEDIKEYVLTNRVYQEEPKAPSAIQHISQTIYQFNVLNQYISRLDTIEKLTKFTQHKQIELMGFEDMLEDKFGSKVRRLENNGFKYGFEMKTNDLLETIDEVSKVCNCKTLEEFNILYDNKFNRLKIYDGVWEDMLMTTGIKKLVETIQSYYWYAYECYLLRKIFGHAGTPSPSKCRELLDEYFKFIGCLDVEPHFKGKNDFEILYNDDDDRHHEVVAPSEYEKWRISEEMGRRYNSIRDNITKSEINGAKKEIMDIIKKNSMRNMDELNKRVAELFQMDEDFKEIIKSGKPEEP